MIDIQAEIDKLLKANPKVLKYVEWVTYVPQGQEPPKDTTHTLKLANTLDDVVVAIKAKPLYGLLADALMKVL